MTTRGSWHNLNWISPLKNSAPVLLWCRNITLSLLGRPGNTDIWFGIRSSHSSWGDQWIRFLLFYCFVKLLKFVKCDKERTVQFFPVDSGRKTMSVTYWSVCLSNTSIKINISGPHLLTLPLNLLWINLQYWISVLVRVSEWCCCNYANSG